MNHLNAQCITFAVTNLSDLPILIALAMLAFATYLILQAKNEAAHQITSYSSYLPIRGVIWKSIAYLMGQHQLENSASPKSWNLRFE